MYMIALNYQSMLCSKPALILRQVVSRYFMGYYSSNICTLLRVVLMEGYGMLSCILGGQVLSGVSGDGMSIAVGVVIVAILVCLFAAFGIRMFNATSGKCEHSNPRIKHDLMSVAAIPGYLTS